MKLLRRHTGKSVAMELVLHVESSGPWPPQYGALAVQWHRGKKSGQTAPAAPDTEGGPATYAFNEALVVPCTLYQLPSGAYESKPLQLCVVQVDERGRELSLLGGAEVDLGAVAAVAGRARQAYPLECAAGVVAAAGGRPAVQLTVGAARGGQRGAALAAALAALPSAADFPSSLSTDEDSSRPGSRSVGGGAGQRAGTPMSVAAPSAGSATPAGPQAPQGGTPPLLPPGSARYDDDGFILDDDLETQDTGGAAGLGPGPPGLSGSGVARALAADMAAATPDSRGGAASSGRELGGGLGSESSSPDPTPVRGRLPQTPPSATQDADSKGSAGRRFARDNPLTARRWTWRRQSETSASASEATPHAGSSPPAQSTPFSAGAAGLAAVDASRQSFMSAASREPSRALSAGSQPDGSLGPGRAAAAGDAADAELRCVAALESAVYLVGIGRTRARDAGAGGEAALQAPARRLARTVIILGAHDGAAFGLRALEAVRSVAGGCLGDAHRLALWWSNVVTLRWSFWALQQGHGGGGGGDGGGQFDWLSGSLLPPLRALEEGLFAESLELMWGEVLLRSAGASAAAAAAPPPPAHPFRALSNGGARPVPAPPPVGAKPGEEGAVVHWTRALRAVEAELAAPGRPPAAPRAHLSLLRHHLLVALLARLDALLFAQLLGDGGALQPALLPFLLRGPLTFETGVQLKMAAGRLANWAADAGVREGPPPPRPDAAAAPAARLFPKLRAAADLLMMPKASLEDAAVRAEVAAALPAGEVVRLLQRYQPEEGGGEGTPPALMKQLKAEASTGGRPAGEAGGGGGEAYCPPSEAALLAEGLIAPLSLAMGDDSDEELGALEARAGGGRRFGLLRELWAGVRAG